MTYTSSFPSYWAVKATSLPSAEMRGNFSSPSCAVIRSATPPAAGTRQRSPSEAKTMTPPPIDG